MAIGKRDVRMFWGNPAAVPKRNTGGTEVARKGLAETARPHLPRRFVSFFCVALLLEKLRMITPSQTPLRAYYLTCPACGVDAVVNLPAHMPETPHCNDCDEDIDLVVVEKATLGWLEYLRDRAAYLALKSEKPEKKE